MPNIDVRTPRGWPLPHQWNIPFDDVQRISASFTAIDGAITDIENELARSNRRVTTLEEDCVRRSLSVITLEITIPAEGWTEDENDTTGYPWSVEIQNDAITETLIPMVTVYPASVSTSRNAGFCPAAQTLEGALRLFAKEPPETEIQASLSLFGAVASIIPGHDWGDFETGDGLTRDAEGKLAVKIGSGLTFDVNRAVAADPQKVVTDDDLLNEDETEQDLKEILLR